MVKNISNPINARRVAQILSEDGNRQQVPIDGRQISIYLSDHRLSDLSTAIEQLRQQSIIPPNFELTDDGLSQLVSEEFIEEGVDLRKRPPGGSEILEFLDTPQINSVEFQNQLKSLKDKLLKSWSGGISIDGKEMDNFDRRFGRPMKYFSQYMEERHDLLISELQAFAVVYATDYLGLGDSSKEDTYELMFGRFDAIKTELEQDFGFKYSWSSPSGTTFITRGKEYSISAELVELAKRFRGISGLDTYPDEVLQIFFLELITGQMMDPLLEKKLIYRWNEGPISDLDPEKYLLPPPEFNIDTSLRSYLTQVVMTQTMMSHFVQDAPSILDLLHETSDMEQAERSIFLAKKLEAAMTRKAVAVQFGTTLANFLENFKTNASKVSPFLDLTYRYFTKTDQLQTLLSTIEHSIRTGLKNSSGLIRQHLKDISNEQLEKTVNFNLMQALRDTVLSHLASNQDEIISTQRVQFDKLDHILRTSSPEQATQFFQSLLDTVYANMRNFAKSLETKKEAPVTTEGGLTELTHDFISTAFYHGSKNPATSDYIEDLVNRGMEHYLAELIVKVSSYMTYQVASKEGEEGRYMHQDLITHFEHKIYQMMGIVLEDRSSLGEHTEVFQVYLIHELRQAHALISLSSRIYTDAYNAWTAIESPSDKHALYLTEFILPNLVYWQRLPRILIKDLLSTDLISTNQIGLIVEKSNRKSMIEPYSLLIMGHKNHHNTFNAAENYLRQQFQIKDNLKEAFLLNPKTGEAEITQESIYLWNSLQEEM